MSKRIIELCPRFDELTLDQMTERLHRDHSIRAELFFSMFHKKWSVNNYFIDVKKGKKIEPKGSVSAKFDDYYDALELAIFEMVKLI